MDWDKDNLLGKAEAIQRIHSHQQAGVLSLPGKQERRVHHT